MKVKGLLPDLAPWRSSRDFRLMWSAGVVTNFGSFLTMVALPVQIKELTGSAVAVGAVGAVELVPLIVFGLYGGALADAVDRKTLIVGAEAAQGLLVVGLLLNTSVPHLASSAGRCTRARRCPARWPGSSGPRSTRSCRASCPATSSRRPRR